MHEFTTGSMSAMFNVIFRHRGAQLWTRQRLGRESHASRAARGPVFAMTFSAACARRRHAADPRIPAHAQIGNTPLRDAKFEFACRSGKGGTLQISVILPPAGIGRRLSADLFEGPDGIGETRDLAEWSVSGAAKPARARTSISGWSGVDGDGFIVGEVARLGTIRRIWRAWPNVCSPPTTRACAWS